MEEEEIVSFRRESDKIIYGVQGYEGDELMAAITGYDLRIAFNMKLINSLADAESCANAMADVFFQALMEQLIAKNTTVSQPGNPETSIL
ncbi:hypothetical protein DW228_18250 [Bacteroides fragilis]|uniref:Uncharacterized protein n=1 Tax=Bacteroides fragilis TaxID=817 RepID=A0A396BUG4_BACFG|nr:hypothetical protein [Bacteroides fragilis]RHH07877.1 hypothetical protein DW228_18250 [Bacteroides fragilis]